MIQLAQCNFFWLSKNGNSVTKKIWNWEFLWLAISPAQKSMPPKLLLICVFYCVHSNPHHWHHRSILMSHVWCVLRPDVAALRIRQCVQSVQSALIVWDKMHFSKCIFQNEFFKMQSVQILFEKTQPCATRNTTAYFSQADKHGEYNLCHKTALSKHSNQYCWYTSYTIIKSGSVSQSVSQSVSEWVSDKVTYWAVCGTPLRYFF